MDEWDLMAPRVGEPTVIHSIPVFITRGRAKYGTGLPAARKRHCQRAVTH